jgi:hypothetical protein
MISLIRPSPTRQERLPDESPRAYRAFCCYRDLGPNRSLDRAWEGYCTTPDEGKKSKSARRPGHWGAWSQKFSWVRRAEAHDDLVDEERRNIAFEQRRALQEQRSRFEAEQQPQIENHVRTMDLILEKMGSAQHHESTQVKCDKDTGKTITTKIKGFNAPGMAVLMKVRNQTAKQAIQGTRDIEETAEDEGTVTRIFWDREAEGLPPLPVRGKKAIPQLPKDVGTAGDDWEDLEKAA